MLSRACGRVYNQAQSGPAEPFRHLTHHSSNLDYHHPLLLSPSLPPFPSFSPQIALSLHFPSLSNCRSPHRLTTRPTRIPYRRQRQITEEDRGRGSLEGIWLELSAGRHTSVSARYTMTRSSTSGGYSSLGRTEDDRLGAFSS